MSSIKDFYLIIAFLLFFYFYFYLLDLSILFTINTIIFLVVVYLINKNIQLKKLLIEERNIYINTLSHDLRVSNIAQIRGLDFLDKISFQDESIHNLVENINDSCKYSLDMITMLLNTYKFKNKESVLNYETFDFERLLKDCIQNTNSLINNKQIRISHTSNTSKYIEADKNFIKKLIIILIQTAHLYANKNSKMVFYTTQNNDFLEFTLSYEGNSLTFEEIQRMFSNQTKFSTVGQGIKMNFCKKIVEFHHGDIKVLKTNQNENIFFFKIPSKKTQSCREKFMQNFFNPSFSYNLLTKINK